MKKFYVVKAEKETYTIFSFKKKKSRYIFVDKFQNKSIACLKAKRCFLIDTSKSLYFAREMFVKSPKDILQLQIQDKIQELGLFTSVPSIVYKIEEQVGPNIEVSLFALETYQLKPIVEKFLKNMVRVEAVYHLVSAVASLTLAYSTKNILSIYLAEEAFWLILTGENGILYVRYVSIDELLGLTKSQVEEGLLAALDYCQRILGVEIYGLIAYGPKREFVPDVAIERLNPKFDIFEGAPLEIIYEYPEFFGSFLVPKEYNFLPEEHLVWIKNLKFARVIGGLFLIISLFNYGIWYFFSNKNQVLNQKILYITKAISQQETFLKKIIHDSKIDLLKEYLTVKNNFENQIRLDVIVKCIIEITPVKVKVLYLGTSPPDFFLERNKTDIKTTNKTLFLIARMEGSFVEVKRTFDTYINRLVESKFLVTNSYLDFNDQNRVGNLYVELQYIS